MPRRSAVDVIFCTDCQAGRFPENLKRAFPKRRAAGGKARGARCGQQTILVAWYVRACACAVGRGVRGCESARRAATTGKASPREAKERRTALRQHARGAKARAHICPIAAWDKCLPVRPRAWPWRSHPPPVPVPLETHPLFRKESGLRAHTHTPHATARAGHDTHRGTRWMGSSRSRRRAPRPGYRCRESCRAPW